MTAISNSTLAALKVTPAVSLSGYTKPEDSIPVKAKDFNALLEYVDGLNTTITTDTVNAGAVVITGSTVTQQTNITTGVTINASKGVITTVSLTTAGGSSSGPFTVTNSYVTANSVILLTAEYASGKTGNPIVQLEGATSAGSFKIKVGNGAPAATALNDVVKIHFVVL